MDIFEKLKLNKAIPPFLEKKGIFVVDDSIGISLLVATAYKKQKDKYLLVCSNLYKAQEVYNLLTSFINSEKIILFPADELIRAETIAESKEMLSQRVYALHKIINNEVDIVVTNVSAATRFLPPKNRFINGSIEFKVGSTYDLMQVRKTLVKSGYLKVNKVDSSLQFALRGDILDIYSVNYDNPIRIEFFGDEIESIRFFDISKQTSISEIKNIAILPANDILFSDEEILNATNKIDTRLIKSKAVLSQDTYENLKYNVEETINKIIEGNIDQAVYKYYSFLSDKLVSLFEYCVDFTKIIVNETAILHSNEILHQEAYSYLDEMFAKGKCINGLELYFDITKLIKHGSKNTIWISDLLEKGNEQTFNVKEVAFIASKRNDCLNVIHSYLNENYKLILALDNKEHAYLIQDILNELEITYETTKELDIPKSKKVGLSLYNLSRGFVLEDEKIAVLTSRELFNTKNRGSRYVNKFKEATIYKRFEDLTPGDYVVHEYQGIGQFIELQTIETNGAQKDFLKIAYAGGEFLYVPLSQFQLVRKYMGKEGYKPKLSHLHSKDWENTKRKIKERINDLAERLMHLYIERSSVKGFAFQKDDEFQEQFENSFPYSLTEDQQKSLDEIKRDMESDKPMDRLLCGDVGFGKTEVAFRAAFKAMLSGKQVAMLCPTTLLARQHYELAKERFASFGVNVGVLSRLVSEKQQQQFIEDAASGKINLLIGTHRLLSKDVSFKDLGLLIIDEEQRFGVEQKEKIKELKTNLDVLTLSATPIPRTLQISLLGVRQLSQINTPPNERMPIQTYVTPFSFDVVKELIERELGRGGQVFFLHNEVSDIYLFANKLAKLIPSASIGVAHGQMNKNDIEDVMMKFYSGDIDVLVCTSIVENGIDVPNANMIIVQDSERYGLAQLYQIKGRVGRSDRIAYAYLMYPEHKKLTENTRKRLKTLQEFTELGSGYKIAQRDLMIRGAGDILGPEQAGFIDNIGLEMYLKLLNEAVKEKLEGQEKEEEHTPLNNTLNIEAFIPSSYASESDKIQLYQEINSCETMEQLIETRLKMIDIYGKPPEEVEMIFKRRSIDVLLKEANAEKLEEFDNYLELILNDRYSLIKGIGNILFETMIPYMDHSRISYKNKRFYIRINKKKDWLDDLISLLNALTNIYKVNKIKEVKNNEA